MLISVCTPMCVHTHVCACVYSHVSTEISTHVWHLWKISEHPVPPFFWLYRDIIDMEDCVSLRSTV